MVNAMAEPRKRAGLKQTTLNVYLGTQSQVSKIARLRDKTIPEFFEDHDVKEFFRHLLIEELEKEALRQKRKS